VTIRSLVGSPLKKGTAPWAGSLFLVKLPRRTVPFFNGLLAAGLCCLATLGCRPAAEQLAPVKGKVSYQGRPLQGGTIVFIPDASRGTNGNLAVGSIQLDGSFVLKTNDSYGAVPGLHKVTIAWSQPAALGVAPLSYLPLKYRDPLQSGLTCEVLADKPNEIEMKLQ
jgi:hypothetical protein